MSIRIMSLVWDDERIDDDGDLLIALSLADQANEDGICWPSTAYTAKRIRGGERSVQYHTARLEEKEILQRVARPGKSNIIQFLYGRGAKNAPPTPARTCTPTPASRCTPPLQADAPIIITEPSAKSSKASGRTPEASAQPQIPELVPELTYTSVDGEPEATPADPPKKKSDGKSELLPTTPGGFKLFAMAGREAQARNHRRPMYFPTLAMKEKFEAAEQRLNGSLETLMRQVIEQGRYSIVDIVNYVAKCDPKKPKAIAARSETGTIPARLRALHATKQRGENRNGD